MTTPDELYRALARTREDNGGERVRDWVFGRLTAAELAVRQRPLEGSGELLSVRLGPSGAAPVAFVVPVGATPIGGESDGAAHRPSVAERAAIAGVIALLETEREGLRQADRATAFHFVFCRQLNAAAIDELIAQDEPAEAVVVAPTEGQLVTAWAGSIHLELVLDGSATHPALTEASESASWRLLELALAIKNRLRVDFGEGVTVALRGLSTAPAGFVSPARCSGSLDVHVAPALAFDDVRERIEQLWGRLQARREGVEYDVPQYVSFPGGSVGDQDHSACAAAAAGWDCGHDPDAWYRASGAANLLAARGVLPVLFGPGSLASSIPDPTADDEGPCASLETFASRLRQLIRHVVTT